MMKPLKSVSQVRVLSSDEQRLLPTMVAYRLLQLNVMKIHNKRGNLFVNMLYKYKHNNPTGGKVGH